MRKRVLMILVAVFMLTCCAPVAPASYGEQDMTSRYIHRWVDHEAGVVCWVFQYYGEAAGISCLPIEHTLIR